MSTLAEPIPTLDSLISKAKSVFQNEFSPHTKEVTGLVCGVAPGRVNLIGEHTDYNDGFVLPMGLPLVTVVVGRKRQAENSNRYCVITTSDECDLPHKIEENLDNLKPGLPK